MAVNKFANKITRSLQERSNPEKAKRMAAYFKQVVNFYGINAPDLNELCKLYIPETKQLLVVPSSGSGVADKSRLHQLVNILFQSTYHESKSIATLLMAFSCKKNHELDVGDLDFVGKSIFDAKLAYNWATVDSLCGKVIHQILINDGNSSDSYASRQLQEWALADNNLWKQRASCVAFVKLARHGRHNDAIIAVCRRCVRSSERFVQLGVGWVLRELFLHDPDRTVDFIQKNYQHFTREALRYAVEKMPTPLRCSLMRYKTTISTTLNAVTAVVSCNSKRSNSRKNRKVVEEVTTTAVHEFGTKSRKRSAT